MPKQKQNWIIDAGLFTGFLLTFFLDLTGLGWHQWLGVFIGTLALYHLVSHWNWVITVSKRLLSVTSKQSRLYYLVDWIVLAGFAAIGISGLMISTWFDLELSNYLLWKNIHLYSSIAALGFILVKIGTHWRWIVKTSSKYFGIWKGSARVPAAFISQGKSLNGSLNRREFLQLMGVAGLASLISASNLLEIGSETSHSIIKSRYYGSNVPQSDLTQGAVQECSPICNQGCTYPGKCRRYTDQNQNGICDLTECPNSENEVQSTVDSSSADPAPQIDPGGGEVLSQTGSQDCLVTCPQGCRYPGQCPDYLDNNSNSYCDYGECLASNTALPYPDAHGGGKGNRAGRRNRGS